MYGHARDAARVTDPSAPTRTGCPGCAGRLGGAGGSDGIPTQSRAPIEHSLGERAPGNSGGAVAERAARRGGEPTRAARMAGGCGTGSAGSTGNACSADLPVGETRCESGSAGTAFGAVAGSSGACCCSARLLALGSCESGRSGSPGFPVGSEGTCRTDGSQLAVGASCRAD